MLDCKRVCRVCVNRVCRVACLALQFALHEYSKFFEGGRNAFIFRYLPGFPGSRAFPVFVLTVGHMAGNRPVGPRNREARSYSV
jgi:hypothetical protein